MGWPLASETGGGLFMYHWGDNLCSIGLVVHLNYKNPWLDPFCEFQRAKTHPAIAPVLKGGKRIGYGARAITEGGAQSVPQLSFPGGALIGCSAGFVNLPRIKGSHNAMKTGMLAAEAAAQALAAGRAGDRLAAYDVAYAQSWVAHDLHRVRNAKPLWSRFGTLLAMPLIGLDLWLNQLFGLSLFGTLRHGQPDFATLRKASGSAKIAYPKPDGTSDLRPAFERFPLQYQSRRKTSQCTWSCAIPPFPFRSICPNMASRRSATVRRAYMK
jgi:electron-transferring-flavoprotein dehydrogenase